MAALVVAVCGLFSCTDWLELAPEDTLSSAIYYTNTQEIFNGVMSAYNRMQQIYLHSGRLPQLVEDASDDCNNVYWANSRVNFFNKTMDDSFGDLWRYSYEMIFRCNYMIKIIDDGNYSAISETDKRNVQAMYGELHFMRALGFFNLVRVYGPVPKANYVFDEPTDAFGIGRAPVAELYADVIIPDLEVAIANCYTKNELPSSQIGRATRGAAQTILAKVYLTPPVKDLNKAKTQLEGVINSGMYRLQPTYADVFEKSNKNHSESIMEIQLNPNLGQGSYYYQWMSNEAGLTNGLSGCGGAVVPSRYDFLKLLIANEERFHTAADTGGYRMNDGVPEWYFQPMIRKFVTYNTGNVPQDHNYMFLRYADVMLMYAEVLSETGGSKSTILEYVNPIRTRAKTPAWTEADVNYDDIMHERRMELCFEGHRWFDLLRQGSAKAIATIEAHFILMEGVLPIPRRVPENQLLFPIPLGQIQIDPTLEQNPGY